MLQISPNPPSPAQPIAPEGAVEARSSDGFEALLAGLMMPARPPAPTAAGELGPHANRDGAQEGAAAPLAPGMRPDHALQPVLGTERGSGSPGVQAGGQAPLLPASGAAGLPDAAASSSAGPAAGIVPGPATGDAGDVTAGRAAPAALAPYAAPGAATPVVPASQMPWNRSATGAAATLTAGNAASAATAAGVVSRPASPAAATAVSPEAVAAMAARAQPAAMPLVANARTTGPATAPGVPAAATAAARVVAARLPVATPPAGGAMLGGLAAIELVAGWVTPGEAALSGVFSGALSASLAADGAAMANLDGGTSGLAGAAVRQVALAVERAVGGELRHLTIQLSPEALGTIEIALEIAHEGDGERRLNIAVLAERPETLELLRGEARQLERLLGQQGVALADSELSFGLMSDGRGDRPAPEDQARSVVNLEAGADVAAADDASGTAGGDAAGPLRAGRLNLFI